MHKIPTYEAAQAAVDFNCPTVLDLFIVENEPAGTDDAMKFRGELQELVNYIMDLDTARHFAQAHHDATMCGQGFIVNGERVHPSQVKVIRP